MNFSSCARDSLHRNTTDPSALVAPVARQLMPQLRDQQRLRRHLSQQKRREPAQVLGVFGQ
jgi:hypothetical protein